MCMQISFIIQYGIVLYIRDHEDLGFSAQKITLKPVSHYLHGALAVLVRYNQAQKYLHCVTLLIQYLIVGVHVHADENSISLALFLLFSVVWMGSPVIIMLLSNKYKEKLIEKM